MVSCFLDAERQVRVPTLERGNHAMKNFLNPQILIFIGVILSVIIGVGVKLDNKR